MSVKPARSQKRASPLSCAVFCDWQRAGAHEVDWLGRSKDWERARKYCRGQPMLRQAARPNSADRNRPRAQRRHKEEVAQILAATDTTTAYERPHLCRKRQDEQQQGKSHHRRIDVEP